MSKEGSGSDGDKGEGGRKKVVGRERGDREAEKESRKGRNTGAVR